MADRSRSPNALWSACHCAVSQAKAAVLVVMGVRAEGTKELIAMADGYRESSESWAGLLRDCRRRGTRAPMRGPSATAPSASGTRFGRHGSREGFRDPVDRDAGGEQLIPSNPRPAGGLTACHTPDR